MVEAHLNHQMVGVEELDHHSQKGVEGVEEGLLHLVVMEVVMGMVMKMEEVIDHFPQGEMVVMEVMIEVMMEMAVEEMIHHHHQLKGTTTLLKL